MLNKSDLKSMQSVTNVAELKNLSDVIIETDLNIEDRINSFFNQINNPYIFLVDNTKVKISFNNNNKKNIEECLASYFENMK